MNSNSHFQFPKVKLTKLLNDRSRFIIPLLSTILVKIIGSIFLYSFTNMGTSETFWMSANANNAVFTSLANQGLRWPFLFLGWDSGWYLNISVKGYAFSNQSVAFFPGLPLFSWLLNIIIKNPAYSMIAISSVVGVLWIPFYQLIAEDYMDKTTALKVTMLYTAIPFVFLFSTVAYSEGLFLLCTLIAWYLFKKGRLVLSLSVASIAVISRSPGLLIVLPMLVEVWKSKGQLKNLRITSLNRFYFLMPFLAYFAWLIYSGSIVGSWYAPGTRSAWNGISTFPSFISAMLNGGFAVAFKEPLEIFSYLFNYKYVVIFILILPVLIYFLFKIDRALALYSAAYAAILLGFGSLDSMPRFVSFIFPIWLVFGTKLLNRRESKYIFPVIIVLLYLSAIYFWGCFLNGLFVA